MVDDLRELRPGHLIIGNGHIFKIAKTSKITRVPLLNGPTGFVLDVMSVRSVPPGFLGGELTVGDYTKYHLCRLTSGDQEAYHEWLSHDAYRYVDVTCVAVGDADPIVQLIPSNILKQHRFTKTDLITYVVAIHGPIRRDDIMRMVAALEGLPWIPTSNTDYFGSSPRKPNSLGGTILLGTGKRGNRIFYTLSDEGKKRANRVLGIVGEAPALAAK